MADYHAIWSLDIVHNYYEGGVCDDFGVGFSGTTVNQLRRRGFIWKMIAVNRWQLLAPNGSLVHPDDTFEFDLFVKKPLFPYITHWPKLMPGQTVLLPSTGMESPFETPFTGYSTLPVGPGILCRILLSTELLRSGGEATTTILFQPPVCHWEYLFIMRDGKKDRMLELYDKEHLLTFDKGIRTEYLGYAAQCYRSVESMPLTNRPKSRICLSEVLPVGKKELYARLPAPVPGQFIDAPPGTIRQVVYL